MSAHGFPKARPFLQVRQEILSALTGPMALRELYNVIGYSARTEDAVSTLVERGEIERCGVRRSMEYGTEEIYRAVPVPMRYDTVNCDRNALAVGAPH